MAAATAAAACLAVAIGCGTSDPLPAGVSTTAPPQPSFVPAEGPCAAEGQVRECHVKLGERDGVLDCYQGVQECRGGQWTACGGKDITLSSINHGAAPGTEAPESHSGAVGIRAVATSTGGQCALDPCNPYCAAYNEDAGLTPEGGAASYYVNMTSIFGGAPGGFAKKSDCGGSSSGCNNAAPGAAYPRKCNGENHYSIWDSCLADTHCDTSKNGGKGSCVANWDSSATADPRWDEAKGTWLPAVCPGVDITVSAACEQGGVAGFNVCNRGNSNATAATIGIFLDNGNGNFGSSTFAAGTCPNHAPLCSPAVPGGVLAPGKCFRVTNANCPAWTGGGNPVAYVNSQRLVAECGGTTTAAAATGPGCNNNWADVKNKGDACSGVGSTLAPLVRTETYTASCPIGFRLNWKFLTYNATIRCSPGACTGTNNSSIKFEGQLRDILPDGGTGAVSPAALSTITTVNATRDCTLSGPAGCPIDLRTWAGAGPQIGYERLDVKITLTPSPDNLVAPTLNSWAVSYDCVPVE